MSKKPSVIDYLLYAMCQNPESKSHAASSSSLSNDECSVDVLFLDERQYKASCKLPRPADQGPNSPNLKRDRKLASEARRFKKDIEKLAVVFLCERVHVTSFESSSWSTPSLLADTSVNWQAANNVSPKPADDFLVGEEYETKVRSHKAPKIADGDMVLNILLDYARPNLSNKRTSLWSQKPHVLSEATSSGISSISIVPSSTHVYQSVSPALTIRMPTVVYLALAVPTKSPFTTDDAKGTPSLADQAAACNKAMGEKLKALLEDLAANPEWLREVDGGKAAPATTANVTSRPTTKKEKSDDFDFEDSNLVAPSLSTSGQHKNSADADDFYFSENDSLSQAVVASPQQQVPHHLLATLTGGPSPAALLQTGGRKLGIDDFAFDDDNILGSLSGNFSEHSNSKPTPTLPPSKKDSTKKEPKETKPTPHLPPCVRRDKILFCLPFPSDVDPVPLSHVTNKHDAKWFGSSDAETMVHTSGYSTSPLEPPPPYIGELLVFLLKTRPRLFAGICNAASDPLSIEAPSSTEACKTEDEAKINIGKGPITKAHLILSTERGNYYFRRKVDPHRGDLVPDVDDDRLVAVDEAEAIRRAVNCKAAVKQRLDKLMERRKPPRERPMEMQMGTWGTALGGGGGALKDDPPNAKSKKDKSQKDKDHKSKSERPITKGINSDDDEELTLADLMAGDHKRKALGVQPPSLEATKQANNDGDSDDDDETITLAELMIKSKKVTKQKPKTVTQKVTYSPKQVPNAAPEVEVDEFSAAGFSSGAGITAKPVLIGDLTSTRNHLQSLTETANRKTNSKTNSKAAKSAADTTSSNADFDFSDGNIANRADELTINEACARLIVESSGPIVRSQNATADPFVIAVIDVVLPYPASESPDLQQYHSLCRAWLDEEVVIPSTEGAGKGLGVGDDNNSSRSVAIKTLSKASLIALLVKQLAASNNNPKVPIKPIVFNIRWEPRSLIKAMGYLNTTAAAKYERHRERQRQFETRAALAQVAATKDQREPTVSNGDDFTATTTAPPEVALALPDDPTVPQTVAARSDSRRSERRKRDRSRDIRRRRDRESSRRRGHRSSRRRHRSDRRADRDRRRKRHRSERHSRKHRRRRDTSYSSDSFSDTASYSDSYSSFSSDSSRSRRSYSASDSSLTSSRSSSRYRRDDRRRRRRGDSRDRRRSDRRRRDRDRHGRRGRRSRSVSRRRRRDGKRRSDTSESDYSSSSSRPLTTPAAIKPTLATAQSVATTTKCPVAEPLLASSTAPLTIVNLANSSLATVVPSQPHESDSSALSFDVWDSDCELCESSPPPPRHTPTAELLQSAIASVITTLRIEIMSALSSFETMFPDDSEEHDNAKPNAATTTTSVAKAPCRETAIALPPFLVFDSFEHSLDLGKVHTMLLRGIAKIVGATPDSVFVSMISDFDGLGVNSVPSKWQAHHVPTLPWWALTSSFLEGQRNRKYLSDRDLYRVGGGDDESYGAPSQEGQQRLRASLITHRTKRAVSPAEDTAVTPSSVLLGPGATPGITSANHYQDFKKCCANLEATNNMARTLRKFNQHWLKKLDVATTPALLTITAPNELPMAVGLVTAATIPLVVPQALPTKVMLPVEQLTSGERQAIRQSFMQVLGRALVGQCRDALEAHTAARNAQQFATMAHADSIFGTPHIAGAPESHLKTAAEASAGLATHSLPGYAECSTSIDRSLPLHVIRVVAEETYVRDGNALRLTVLYTKANYRVSMLLQPPSTGDADSLTPLELLSFTVLDEAPTCNCTAREGLDGNGQWRNKTLTELHLCRHIVEVTLWYLQLADRAAVRRHAK